MSNNNYMDRVPVKISEKFKPPPKLYQLPQVIANRLQLPDKHYDESPHYDYDFQLERKVLAKIPEWRRMRQQEREARRERKERREQEHLFQIEAKNKQMLGAVSYPSTDDLSSSDSDSGELDEKAKHQNDVTKTMQTTEGETRLLLSNQVNSFHTILQPTIISNSSNEKFQMLDGMVSAMNLQQTNSALKHVALSAGPVKDVNAFNYRDFEEDTSSPFDNIELKTINDLDILAQVLHNTQVPSQNEKQIDSVAGGVDDTYEREQTPKDNNTHDDNAVVGGNMERNHQKDNKDTTTDVDNREILENTKLALKRVEFESLVEEENESIPNSLTKNSIAHTKYLIGANSNMPTIATSTTSFNTFPNQQQSMQQCYQISYNAALTNGIGGEQQQQQQYTNYNVHHTRQGGGGGTSTLYGNHNYLQQATNYNDNIAAYCSPRHLPYHNAAATATALNTAYVCNNANNYTNTMGLSSCSAIPKNLQQQQSNKNNTSPNDCNDIDAKSKSVPDILRELSAEVRNSEIRRSRYYSFNSEEEKQSAVNHSVDEDVTPTQSPTKVKDATKETNYYAKLPRPAQRLVKNISSMGFPLERVAKISQIFGTDDKKIIEHLIPLSELMDLGFDESKISEALIQFDNNKEKALEYLIS